ncbi:MAG: hypothetical protein GY847_21900 [Proteobacteria bacterium]|nr:hypothetical protein [Pseudomonadota bacterium]
MTTRTGAENTPKIEIIFCTNDLPQPASRFVELINPGMNLSLIRQATDCTGTEIAPGPEKKLIGTFVHNPDGKVYLELTPARKKSSKHSREVSWLNSIDKPLELTINANKVAALSILLDNMLLGYTTLKLSTAPPLPTEQDEVLDRPAPDQQVNGDTTFYAIETAGGVKYISPDTLAPVVALGFAWGKNRWSMPMRANVDLDSNFKIEGRSFDTFGAGLQIGAGYLFYNDAGNQIGTEILALWHLNIYRRSDLEDATFRTWSDFGLGIFFNGRYKLAGIFGILVRLGVEFYPTARIASIKNGPEKKTNLFSMPIVAGFDLIF